MVVPLVTLLNKSASARGTIFFLCAQADITRVLQSLGIFPLHTEIVQPWWQLNTRVTPCISSCEALSDQTRPSGLAQAKSETSGAFRAHDSAAMGFRQDHHRCHLYIPIVRANSIHKVYWVTNTRGWMTWYLRQSWALSVTIAYLIHTSVITIRPYLHPRSAATWVWTWASYQLQGDA